MAWFYLSFATDTTFLGACVIKASDVLGAVEKATRLELNPGGEIMILPVDGPGPFPPHQLMSKAEMQKCDPGGGKSLRELRAEGVDTTRYDGARTPMVHQECNPVKR